MCIPMLPFNYSYKKWDNRLIFADGFLMLMPVPIASDVISAQAVNRKKDAERKVKERANKKRTFNEAQTGWGLSNDREEARKSESIVSMMADLSIEATSQIKAVSESKPNTIPKAVA